MTPETKEWLEHLEELLLTLCNILMRDGYVTDIQGRIATAKREYQMRMEGL